MTNKFKMTWKKLNKKESLMDRKVSELVWQLSFGVIGLSVVITYLIIIK